MIGLCCGRPNDFDRGWTMEGLWGPHAGGGRLVGWPHALWAKVIICSVCANKCGAGGAGECCSVPAFYCAGGDFVGFGVFQLKMSSCKHSDGHFYPNKNGDRSLAFWDEMFWSQLNFFCVVERRGGVAFTGSIGAIFVGVSAENDGFGPECGGPPP